MRRIQRDVRHEEFIKSLTTGEAPLFRDIWRVLLFAAAYGVSLKSRRPLEKVESNKAMPETYFSTPGWKGFLYLLGFLNSSGSDHLKGDPEQQDRLVTAFEEYANFGLSVMAERVSRGTLALDSILDLINESGPQKPQEIVLNDLL